jgi:branched-chain amino acid transport system substrate-binding protein
MVPVAEQLKIVIVGLATTAPIKEWNAWSYRINPVASVGMPILVRAIAKKTGMKKLAIIFDQTQDGHVAAARATRGEASTLGIQLVADVAFRTGDQDFSAQVSKIKATGPDVIGVMGAPGDGAKVCLQIRDGGLKQPLFTPDGQFTDTVYWDTSNGAVQGGFTFLGLDLSAATGAVKKFMEDYTKAYPEQSVNLFSAYGYDGLHTAVAAVKKANTGTDRLKFQQALASLETTTPLGSKITFKNPPNGENLTPTVTVVQITGRGCYVRVE